VLTVRPCPVCGDTDDSHERFAERIDRRRIGELSYASRKEPEFMNLRMVVCPRCELLYAPRVPESSELARAYADSGYDSAAEAEFAASSYAQALRRRLDELPDRGAALDIGAGNGALLEHLRALGFGEVIGVEPSRAAADAAAAAVRPMIRVERFDPQRLPQALRQRHFTLVIANQTLEHVDDPFALLGAARRLLKPGGALMIVSHDYRHPLMRLLGRHSPIIDIGHLQLFSRSSLGCALTRAGFGNVAIEPFANRYPLHYWTRLLPIPRVIKRPLYARLRTSPVGQRMFEARVGNLMGWARN
jgi:SAM-dependent methyltransferase